MAVQVDDALLQTLRQPLSAVTGPAAGQTVGRLGALARWWLHDQVREAAATGSGRAHRQWLLETPPLPTDKGACWIAIAQRLGSDGVYRYPWLQPAFALPLRWVHKPSASAALPPALRMIVADVLVTLGHAGEWSLKLALNDPSRDYELFGLTEGLEFASAWAPLAGSLIGVCENRRPNPKVWSSGAWHSDHGFLTIGDLESKLELAHRHGASLFFVPDSQLEAARLDSARLGIEVRGLQQGSTEVHKAARDYLRVLSVPPGLNDPIEERSAWYLSIDGQEEAEEYHRACLLDELVGRCRDRSPTIAALGTPEWHVVFADNVPLVEFLVKTLRPQNCLILHTTGPTSSDDKTKSAEQTSDRLATFMSADRVHVAPVGDVDAIWESTPSSVREYIDSAAPAQVVLDLTPGTKLMSLALAMNVAKDGYTTVYLKHRFTPFPRRRRIPDSEQYMIWRGFGLRSP